MSAPSVEWAVAERALPGEAESGDLSTVTIVAGTTLVAAVDGLGHGPEAAAAARLAIATLRDHATEPLDELFRRCHAALLRTRGVVMTVARVGLGELEWLAVGNVEGVLVHATPDGAATREHVLPRGGVVGGQLPPLKSSVRPLAVGDTLVLATDGIPPGQLVEGPWYVSPQALVERLLRSARSADDALVLAVRYRGVSS